MSSDNSVREGYFHVIESPRETVKRPTWYTQEIAEREAERSIRIREQIMAALAAGLVFKQDKTTYG